MRKIPALLALSTLVLPACSDTPAPPAAVPAVPAVPDDHAAHNAPATAPATPSSAPAGARVRFRLPQDGAKVSSPVTVAFELEGMKLRPAGEDPADQTSGHHHVIVDGAPILKGTAVPADEKHIHYGKGQSEATLELSPGKHTLTLQLADGAHLSYGPELSHTITVEVEP